MSKAFETIKGMLDADFAKSGRVLVMSPQVRARMRNIERLQLNDLASDKGIAIHVDNVIEPDRVILMTRSAYEEHRKLIKELENATN